MPRIAVTGHMKLTAESGPLIREAILGLLRQVKAGELVGVSCLARGADTIFAQAVIDVGGALEVVVPSADYRRAKVRPDHAAQFDRLLALAVKVHTAPFSHAGPEAYEAANRLLLSSCDVLYAVWDGESGVDRGSTGAVVQQARVRGIPVEVVWPGGARRADTPAAAGEGPPPRLA